MFIPIDEEGRIQTQEQAAAKIANSELLKNVN
jgi:hypothetical protein